ncbi:MAG: hypothetical protein ACI8WB_001800 [Phenylobacterium sp.]|jgi:hypothetical protein
MGKLEEALVNRLLEASPNYKQNDMEQTIRQLLGAQPFTDVTGLPPRRGKADGGFDGQMTVSHLVDQSWQETLAGLNVKVRIDSFSRGDLALFILDMDREKIDLGFIITAAYLSPDAKVELQRKNDEGNITLFHLRLSDILSNTFNLPTIQIQGQSLNTVLTDNLQSLLKEIQ